MFNFLIYANSEKISAVAHFIYVILSCLLLCQMAIIIITLQFIWLLLILICSPPPSTI